MEENFEREERGLSFGDICRIMFSQKWLALAIVIIVTVAASLGMYYRNKSGEVYSSTFLLQLPNTISTSTVYTYPDGDSFYFTDLTTLDNLKDAASLAGLNGLDVDKMVKRGDISIVRTINKIDETSIEGNIHSIYEFSYTIEIKAKYFKSESEASSFVKAIVSLPVKHIGSMELDYDKSLTSSKSATTYVEQLNLLEEQILFVRSEYANLANEFGDSFILENGKSLAGYIAELDAYLENDIFSALKARANDGGYIKNKELAYQYENELLAVEHKLELAEATRDELLQFAKEGVVFSDELVNISREIANLMQQKRFLEDNYIESLKNDKSTPKDFTDELQAVENAVTKFTEDLEPVESYIYGKVTKVDYLSSKVVEIKGGSSIIKTALICFVVAIVAAAVIAFIVGYAVKQSKDRRLKEVAVGAVNASDGDKKEE